MMDTTGARYVIRQKTDMRKMMKKYPVVVILLFNVKELSANNLNILRPSLRRLWPILNHKILNITLLCLRFCSIGSTKFNANPNTILPNLFADSS